MTGRSVPEWVGRTPDTTPPPRVRLRVFEAKLGRCHKCKRKIGAGEKWTCEHIQALINGGENRERNLDVTCDWCLPQKNAEDAEIKSKNYRVRLRHAGLKKSRRPMPGSKASKWKRKLDGRTVPR